jgi:aromatic ring-opening dioxygenase catalytic subunit (LigB family)
MNISRPAQQPTFFIPHGGGPCFFMDDPLGTWTTLASFLGELPGRLPEPPTSILVVSGHWETESFAFTGAARPSLIYDYYGFPPHTYQLSYAPPGAPDLALRAKGLLNAAGIASYVDPERGLDHGVFVPMKVAFPQAKIPVVEMSVKIGLDPGQHLAAGHALSKLREEGVLILGSGMSFHNMRGYGDPRFTAPSDLFDHWLSEAVQHGGAERIAQLSRWESAPAARLSHPREEHLLPLMVAAGAADGPGEKVFSDHVLKTAIAGFLFR